MAGPWARSSGGDRGPVRRHGRGAVGPAATEAGEVERGDAGPEPVGEVAGDELPAERARAEPVDEHDRDRARTRLGRLPVGGVDPAPVGVEPALVHQADKSASPGRVPGHGRAWEGTRDPPARVRRRRRAPADRARTSPSPGSCGIDAEFSGPAVGDGFVVVHDDAVPRPRGRALEVRADGLWTEMTCETPDEHWSFGLEAFGLRVDDPAETIGERLAVGYDLEWETPDRRARRAAARSAPSIPIDATGTFTLVD